MFDKISEKMGELTVGKVTKATLIGGGVCLAAIAGPIGVLGVVSLTAVGAGASWVAESIGDSLSEDDKKQ